MVSVVLKEKAADQVSIVVNVFKNDNKVGKPELVHKRITCYKKSNGFATNLCSIQCGIGLPLLYLTLNDIQGVLRGEQNNDTSIDVYAEPYFFDIFKSTIDRESTKVGLKAS